MVLINERRKIVIYVLIFVFLSGVIISGCLNKKIPSKNVVTHVQTETLHKNFFLEGPIYNANAGQYKGGLKELTEWVPHLKDLGVKTVVLSTIWSNSGYTPDDYYKVAPRLGTDTDLKKTHRDYT